MHDIDQTLSEYPDDEMDEYEFDEMELDEFETVFDEATEMEFASDLLEVTDDDELEEFLGKLIKRAGRTLGRFVRSPTGRSLGRALKGIAKTALPAFGRAFGTMVPPGFDTSMGGVLGQSAGRLFGLELEGLSPEDQEFEVARRIVRLAGDAVKKASSMPSSTEPHRAAKIAIKTAASKTAPGLLHPGRQSGMSAAGPRYGIGTNAGRWVRRGRRIVILGV